MKQRLYVLRLEDLILGAYTSERIANSRNNEYLDGQAIVVEIVSNSDLMLKEFERMGNKSEEEPLDPIEEDIIEEEWEIE